MFSAQSNSVEGSIKYARAISQCRKTRSGKERYLYIRLPVGLECQVRNRRCLQMCCQDTQFFFIQLPLFLIFRYSRSAPKDIGPAQATADKTVRAQKFYEFIFSNLGKRKRVDKLFFGLIGFSCSIDFNKYCLNF